jgi:oligopeptide/dipeptide ABC transporter ATP-binding protein
VAAVHKARGASPAAARVDDSSSLLKLEGLTIGFRSGDAVVQVVHGVSWSVRKGEAVGLVGESGSGKSVTALSILGLLPENAQVKGRAFLSGVDLLSLSPRELLEARGRDVGMVFQDPLSSLDPTMVIERQVVEPLRVRSGLSRRAAHQRALEILDLVGISDPRRRLQQYPHELSGGMRQRVMLAAALIAEPELLIADEPTTALDVTIQAQIIELLERLRRDMAMAIVLITHNLGVVARLVDRVNVMYAGRIVESGTAEAVLSNPAHPYTRGLLASVPRTDEFSSELTPIPGLPPNPRELPNGCTFWPRCPRALPVCQREYPATYAVGDAHSSSCWLHETGVEGGPVRPRQG